MKTKNNIFSSGLAALILLASLTASDALATRPWTAARPARPYQVATSVPTPTRMETGTSLTVEPQANLRQAKAAKADESQVVVISEDFSKFAAGSEEAPDMTNILNSEGVIMQDYVHTYGWAGISIYQAGGSCFLADGKQALLITPVLNLADNNGDFVVSLSYRMQSGTGNFKVISGSAAGPIAKADLDATAEWQDVTLEFPGGVSQTVIQFYGDAPAFVDNISITQVQSGEVVPDVLPAPQVSEATGITATGFTANWSAVEGATAYLLDVFYFENNEKQYVHQDLEVQATTHTVSDLEADKLYYYSVQATDGTLTSAESSMVVVLPLVADLDTPEVLPATNVTSTGFTANWTAVDSAAFYEVDVVANLPIASAGTATIEDEGFNGVDMGTETSPAYHTMQGDLNAYTRYPDWYGVTLMLAEGKVGLKNYAAAMEVYSMLYTPVYQVSDTPGTVKLSLTVDAVSCSAQTKLGVVMVEITETGETPVGDWQFATLTGTGKQLDFTLGACGSYYIAIGFNDPADPYGTNAVVYIDQLKVTQELEAGAVLSRLSHMATAYNPSVDITVQEELRNGMFYYYVYGVSFGTNGQFYSAPSDIMPVQLPTKAESTVADGLRLYAEPGQLTVVAVAESEAVIYDASGRAVQAARLAPGANTFALQPGLYFVRSGADTYKALLQ